ncbi:MAG: glucose-1-phosphate thymidylyltransferase, bifunctional UDP-N-acetylglucosamine pyrophosphorylase / Glucosamine-1-phosphate N-acetyltransferase [Candidatus Peregrinibacteria bacterium GW2011_GWE2_39_6]|nr:MAG: glucose-1-phosphate thymidylyltransferase, bifunctional UDP-N-acetylglucosamine pyrophosphorylase / Glucosamine-1-phosphate N-acetyltransferase [Candidatus Peregrinibacteria bacterium GW2011_GWF2_39_17]KKR25695.1 MAG: glucose-1-phosphate thymidylyltransferase, bifunctional UDP-N-acetylglucosamine pyrophosphorylase / Glucosamine-1-phosphate N-acetyltransferase [Candidatus Peregrinibacteria bacterium GW2011_GWE2_39_6]
MKVILLAAGRSQRVKPIEDKNFLRFCGKYLIEHQIEAILKAGFKEFIVVAGKHNLLAIKNLLSILKKQHKNSAFAVALQKNLDQGMTGAVLAAKSKLKANESIMIISTNDVVDSKAYQIILEASRNNNFDSYLLGKKVSSYFPGGYLKTNSKGEITQIIEKPGAGKEPSNLINLVVHLHKNTKALYSYLKNTKSSRDDHYEVALDQMIKDGIKIKAIPYDGYWQAIKYPWHIFEVAAYFFQKTLDQLSPKKRLSSNTKIAKSVTIKGEVIIEDGVRIFENATIVGPAYLGKDSVVATNALVRESYLGKNCVIGYNTEVARSFLGDEVWTHSNYIGDSLIGNNVSFGAGSITGNLRFDEGNIAVEIKGEKINSQKNKLGIITGNNIRVGVNTSFMPGIKIGSNSLIGAGLTINQNIPENSFVSGKISLDIKENRKKKLASRQVLHSKLK